MKTGDIVQRLDMSEDRYYLVLAVGERFLTCLAIDVGSFSGWLSTSSLIFPPADNNYIVAPKSAEIKDKILNAIQDQIDRTHQQIELMEIIKIIFKGKE